MIRYRPLCSKQFQLFKSYMLLYPAMHSMHLDTSRFLGSTADDNHARKTTPADKEGCNLEKALFAGGAVLLIAGAVFLNHHVQDPFGTSHQQGNSSLIAGCVLVVIGVICLSVWSIEYCCCSHPISRWMGFLPNK